MDAVFLRGAGFGVGELRNAVLESLRKSAAIAIPTATATPKAKTHILLEIRSMLPVLCKPDTIFKTIVIQSFFEGRRYLFVQSRTLCRPYSYINTVDVQIGYSKA